MLVSSSHSISDETLSPETYTSIVNAVFEKIKIRLEST